MTQLVEGESLRLNQPAQAVGFLPPSGPFDFWVASWHGEICGYSESLELKLVFDSELRALNDVIFDDENQFFVGVGAQGVRICDLELNRVFEPAARVPGDLYRVVARDELKILSGGSNERLFEIDLLNGEFRELCNLGESLFSLALHPILPQVLATFDRGAKCLAVALNLEGKSEPVPFFAAQTQEMTAFFTPDGGHVLAFERILSCQSFPGGEVLWRFCESRGFIHAPIEADWRRSHCWSNPIFAPNGHDFFCGSPGGKIYFFDALTGQLHWSLPAHEAGIEHLAISADAQRLISVDSQNNLRQWKIELGGEANRN